MGLKGAHSLFPLLVKIYDATFKIIMKSYSQDIIKIFSMTIRLAYKLIHIIQDRKKKNVYGIGKTIVQEKSISHSFKEKLFY